MAGRIHDQAQGRPREGRAEVVPRSTSRSGSSAFGMNVVDLQPGEKIPEHDETGRIQEEVFVTLAGSPTIVIDGVEHPAPEGTFVRLDPEPMRTWSTTAQTRRACSSSRRRRRAATSRWTGRKRRSRRTVRASRPRAPAGRACDRGRRRSRRVAAGADDAVAGKDDREPDSGSAPRRPRGPRPACRSRSASPP